MDSIDLHAHTNESDGSLEPEALVAMAAAAGLRALAVTAPKRVDSLPDIPTFAEAGLPGVDVNLWFAVLVPGATQQAIVNKLNADIVRAVADPDYRTPLA